MTDDAVSDASSGYFARILTTFAHYSHIYPFRLNMKKKLWLIHQHCTRVILDERGHHYWIVKELAQRGYEPVVFCSNFDHYSRKFVDESNPLFFERTLPCGAKCVFIRSNAYYNSGRDYARSLFLFYRNLMKVAKIYTTSPAPPPDIILASSPSPFVVAAGEKLAKKFRVPCVAEIRDLWPESIFAYFPQKRNKWYAKFLQNYERKIYERADAIIMTWAGGADYIVDQGWESTVDLKKVHHVAHGVDIEEFDQLVKERPFFDPDLADKTHFKAVYTGSVRFVNNLGMCVDAARILRDRGNDHIRILVWGQGTELDALRNRVKELGLTNIVFKGLADRKNIPSILTQSDCALLHNTSTVLNKYGQSQNKFYEYLAAAKPILMTYCVGRSVIKKEGCGIELDQQTPESIANALEKLEKLPREEYDVMAANARRVGESLDTKFQMEKRIKIIEDL